MAIFNELSILILKYMGKDALCFLLIVTPVTFLKPSPEHPRDCNHPAASSKNLFNITDLTGVRLFPLKLGAMKLILVCMEVLK